MPFRPFRTSAAILRPAFFTLLFATALHAQVFVDDTASGANDGSSWTNAFNSLQDALAAVTSGQQIHVAQGTYYPDLGTGQTDNNRSSTFQLINNVEILGGFPDGGGALASRNPATHVTILSGDLAQNDGPFFSNANDNAIHVLTGSGTNATAILDGFTISAGNANGSASSALGGGLYNDSGSPSLSNCSFEGNQAGFGGATTTTPHPPSPTAPSNAIRPAPAAPSTTTTLRPSSSTAPSKGIRASTAVPSTTTTPRPPSSTAPSKGTGPASAARSSTSLLRRPSPTASSGTMPKSAALPLPVRLFSTLPPPLLTLIASSTTSTSPPPAPTTSTAPAPRTIPFSPSKSIPSPLPPPATTSA
ncbi:MAG: hypothetical protein AAGJ79_09860 [Verrucomicrobiota bacterium]